MQFHIQSAVAQDVPPPLDMSRDTGSNDVADAAAADTGYEITQLDDDPFDYGDIDAGIAAHADAGDTLEAMIAAAVTERNSLRVQNEQMWKIIEKQRSIIQQLNDERARDKDLITRFSAAGGDHDSESAHTTSAPIPPPKKHGVSFKLPTDEISAPERIQSLARPNTGVSPAVSPVPRIELVQAEEHPITSLASDEAHEEGSSSGLLGSKSSKVNVNRLSKARLSLRISEEDAELYNMYFSSILDSDSSSLDLASSLFIPPPPKEIDAEDVSANVQPDAPEETADAEVEESDKSDADAWQSGSLALPRIPTASLKASSETPQAELSNAEQIPPKQRPPPRISSAEGSMRAIPAASAPPPPLPSTPLEPPPRTPELHGPQRPLPQISAPSVSSPFVGSRSSSEPALVINTVNGSPASQLHSSSILSSSSSSNASVSSPRPPGSSLSPNFTSGIMGVVKDLSSAEGATVEVLSSRPQANSDRTVVFVVSVRLGQDTWYLEKGFSEFSLLDSKLRASSRNQAIASAPPVEKSFFNSFSVYKFEHRKLYLEQYLTRAIEFEKASRDLIEFLVTGAFTTSPSRKESRTPRSTAIEAPPGKDLVGTIKLKHCLVSRIPPGSEPASPFAFALVEYRSGSFQGEDSVPPESKVFARHILGPQDENDREEWLRLLAQQISEVRPSGLLRPTSNVGPGGGPDILSPAPSVQSIDSLPYQRPNSFQPRHLSAAAPWLPPPPTGFSPGVAPSPLSSPPQVPGGFGSSPGGGARPPGPPPGMLGAVNGTAAGGGSAPGGDAMSALMTASNNRMPTKNVADDHARTQAQHPLPLPLIDVSWVQQQQQLQQQQSLQPGAMLPPTPGGSPSYPGAGPLGPRSMSNSSGGSGNARPAQAGAVSGVNKMVSNALGWGRKKPAAEVASRPSAGRGVFGVPLEQVVATTRISDTLELPAIVYRCIDYLLVMKAIEEEGIYRLSGSSSVIQQLKERFNNDGDVDLVAGEPYDVHAVAGVLKLFLRELPTPILTHQLTSEFIAILDLDDRNERVQLLAQLASRLPPANRTLLRVLCSHLVEVVQRSDINKMTVRNVAIVFSPTLAVPAGVFGLMLAEFDAVFGENSGAAALNAGAPPPPEKNGA
ncbi:hypothetical protein HK405_015198 [Cladochytrium tenue]|nr:hypothetical protein HK405_015198 [Cladochytrium tenue]